LQRGKLEKKILPEVVGMHNIMIVDDEQIEIDYLRGILSKHPLQFNLVAEAVNGRQAVNEAFDKKPDLIIMDIVMPVMDGIEAARIIKSKHEKTIVVLNSAYSEFEYAHKAVNLNLEAYLLKPAEESEIVETLKKLLDIGRFRENDEFEEFNSHTMTAIDYPYRLTDQINEALSSSDGLLLDKSIEVFKRYLVENQTNFIEHKLFVINAIFSCMKTIKKIFPGDLCSLVNSEDHLRKIVQSKHWKEMYLAVEDFFSVLSLVFRNFYLSSSNVSDLIENYIDNHFTKRVNLKQLAEIFHFSPSYLSKKFHEDKKITISDYLNLKRVEFAKYLIENSTLNINIIAGKAGFASATHFNRVFKRLTGENPTDYKRNGAKV
jgi:YesN/AraC family two-component response regulator